MPEAEDLAQKKCKPCEGGTKPLNRVMVEGYLATLPEWAFKEGWIEKTFTFQNFHETMSFVNAVAFIANREDHHPDLEVGYKACKVKYTTHAIKGLSENDFICAAKVEALLKNS